MCLTGRLPITSVKSFQLDCGMGSFRGASGHYGENGGFLREPSGNRDFTTLKDEGGMGVY